MDGFFVRPDGSWMYGASENAPRPKGSKWVPWDKAPQEWRSTVERSGARGSKYDLTNPAPGPGEPGAPRTDPLSQQAFTAPTTSPRTSGGGGGFLPDSSKSTTDKVLGWLKNNWQDVLGAGVTAYGVYQGQQDRNRSNALSDEGLRLSREQWEAGAPARDFFMGNFQKMPEQPDLRGAFADSSNPFYSTPERVALPSSWSPSAPGGLPKGLSARELMRRGIG